MTIQNFKFIGYNGGTAGDLFTISCNGHRLNPTVRNQTIPNANGQSIKPYEEDIVTGKINLESILSTKTSEYVSTHLTSMPEKYQNFLINVVVDDPAVQEIAILRQMQFQQLRILVDPLQHWFLVVSSLCKRKKFKDAADYWLHRAREVWLKKMSERINSDHQSINFNQIFVNTAGDSLEKQGWTHNIDIFNYNHQIWIDQNREFSKEKTIQSMIIKLQSMQWHKESGVIFSKSLLDLT